MLCYFFNVYLFLRQRETEHEWGRSRERGRHRIGSRLQALSHQPRAWRRARTHEPWDRDLSWIQTPDQLSHPGTLRNCFKVDFSKPQSVLLMLGLTSAESSRGIVNSLLLIQARITIALFSPLMCSEKLLSKYYVLGLQVQFVSFWDTGVIRGCRSGCSRKQDGEGSRCQ